MYKQNKYHCSVHFEATEWHIEQMYQNCIQINAFPEWICSARTDLANLRYLLILSRKNWWHWDTAGFSSTFRMIKDRLNNGRFLIQSSEFIRSTRKPMAPYCIAHSVELKTQLLFWISLHIIIRRKRRQLLGETQIKDAQE